MLLTFIYKNASVVISRVLKKTTTATRKWNNYQYYYGLIDSDILQLQGHDQVFSGKLHVFCTFYPRFLYVPLVSYLRYLKRRAMSMSNEGRSYRSYLLRLWESKSRGKGTWRASLQDPHTGKRKGFASLRDLFTFLEEETGHRVRDQTTPNADEKGGDAE
jgi:hypothetical protein